MTDSRPPSRRIDLVETTVAEIDGVRVGLSNVWDEAFVDPSGRTRQGVRGTISVMPGDSGGEDRDFRVSVGDGVSIAGSRYRVIAITEGDDRGGLTLERVPEEGRTARWIDVLLPLPFLALPYLASSPATRALLALLGLVAWVLLLRPTWRGLRGFYGSALLGVHALVWAALALFAGLFG